MSRHETTFRAIGRDLMHGAIAEAGKWVITFLLIVTATYVADRVLHFLPRDDSDTPTKFSGMTIRTDALTGCEYLESGSGSLTARLNSSGEQICVPAGRRS
jgi:hypothetical protein